MSIEENAGNRMTLLNKLPIKGKFVLLFLIFIIPLLFFVTANVWEELEKQNNLSRIQNRLSETKAAANVIHELQQERGVSQRYYGSKGRSFIDEYQSQIKATDKAIIKFQQIAGISDVTFTSTPELSRLPIAREKIQSVKADTNFIHNFYSELITDMLGDMEHISQDVIDLEVKAKLNSYVSLSKAKENLGQIRSMLTRALTRGEFSRIDYGEFSINTSSFDLFLNQFLRNSEEDLIEVYEQKMSKENVKRTLTIIETIKNYGDITPLNVTSGEWFFLASQTLESITEIEATSLNNLTNILSKKIEAAKMRVIIYVTLLIAVFLIAVILSAYIIRIITSSVYELRNASNKLVAGETDIQIRVKTEDELGELAKSFSRVAEKNHHLSKVAESIGKGDYAVVVNVAGENDILGNSILRMRNNLKELAEKERKRRFLLEGNDLLNNLMRGEKNVPELADKVVKHLCSYLGLQVGAFFIADEDNFLYLNGTFGIKEGDLPDRLEPGEGMVGQAAVSKEAIILHDIPEYFIRISSSFIEQKPKSIYIIPLVFEGNTIGVIELAGILTISEDAMEYLQTVKEKIAIVLLNILSEIKTNELLLETQNQAEELETQQEELRQINDELKDQSMRLQASEEELRTSQEELQEKNAELEEKANQLEEQYESIREKNTELEEARKAIQDKVEQLEITGKYKSEFLANMSHELRTPLNSILILAKLLSDNKFKNLNEKQVEYSKVIHKSGSDLLLLINEILDLSKIEAGKVSLQLEEWPVNVFDLKTDFQEVAFQNGINFEVSLDKNLPEKIQTDKFRVEQILKNLLSNAFKFTEKGGTVKFEILRPDPSQNFRNRSLYNKDIIAFSIKDTGIGIPTEKQNLIFEAFQQADTSTSRKFGGTGLGLSISRELAAVLGGEIHLSSIEGEGSNFTLFLPVKHEGRTTPDVKVERPKAPAEKEPESVLIRPEKKHEAKPLVKENIAPGKPKLLIVEDDISFSEILSDYAKERGFHPIIAHDGESALRLAAQYLPDAILMDIYLPKKNGWEVLKEIKKMPELATKPVHVISAADDEELGKELGVVNFLKKPLSTDTLEKVFGNIIQLTQKPIRKILVVEDDPIQNSSIKELLFSREIPSESAFSAKEAVDKLTHQHFDVAILDLNLPDMNGFEFLEALDKNPDTPKIPVIIYSGKDLSEKEEERLKKYTNAIIVKTAESNERLLNEVTLFLHNVKDQIPGKKQKSFTLHKPGEALHGKKVLLVDDDIRNIYALYNVFEDQGLEIITAGNGKEALLRLEENPDTNIVLMDIMMPEMNGYEAMQKIRENEKYRNLPIVALTAKAMKGDREKCIQAGASDYIPKPIDVERLLSLMRVWLYDKSR